MDCNGKDKPKRSKNFTDGEKYFLLELVKPNIEVLENKMTNATYNKIKSECWNTIAAKYNPNQMSGERTGVQLKSLFKQMKRSAKINNSNNELDEMDEKVLQLLEKVPYSDNTIDWNEDSQSMNNYTSLSPGFYKAENESDDDNLKIDLKSEEDNLKINMKSEAKEGFKIKQELAEDVLKMKFESEPAIPENVPVEVVVGAHTSNNPRIGRRQRMRVPERSRRVVMSKCRSTLYNKRLELMELMKEVEMENLRGMRIENETRVIVKEREELELRIKRLRYSSLLKEGG